MKPWFTWFAFISSTRTCTHRHTHRGTRAPLQHSYSKRMKQMYDVKMKSTVYLRRFVWPKSQVIGWSQVWMLSSEYRSDSRTRAWEAGSEWSQGADRDLALGKAWGSVSGRVCLPHKWDLFDKGWVKQLTHFGGTSYNSRLARVTRIILQIPVPR